MSKRKHNGWVVVLPDGFPWWWSARSRRKAAVCAFLEDMNANENPGEKKNWKQRYKEGFRCRKVGVYV